MWRDVVEPWPRIVLVLVLVRVLVVFSGPQDQLLYTIPLAFSRTACLYKSSRLLASIGLVL